MYIIGLVGKIGSGKTAVAKILEENLGFKMFAFADPVKETLIKAGLVTHEEAYITKPPRCRELMQKIGTDIFREQVSPDFWIKKTAEEITKYCESKDEDTNINIVIHDVRFLNEARAISSANGILIRIVGKHTEPDSHISETEQELIRCDRILTNLGTIEELKNSVYNVLKTIDELRDSVYNVIKKEV